MRPAILLSLCSMLACDGGDKAPDEGAKTAKAEPAREAEPAKKTEPEKKPESEAKPEATDGPKLIEGELDTSAEHLGPIHQGLTEKEVINLLGEPEKREDFVMEEATGEHVASWDFPEQDLVLHMSGDDTKGKNAVVAGFTCSAKCSFGLPWGLKIGSTRAEVEKIYGEHHDPDFTDEHTFIAGSVYGGSFYRFEDGQVVSIFVGAGAE